MKKLFFFLALGVFTSLAPAFVDTKNAGYTKSYLDISLSSSNLPLLIQRTYNSRSLYKGMFGYGWCSNLETRLEVRPDGSILVVECGGGKEVLFVSGAGRGNESLIVGSIMSKVRKNKTLTPSYIKKVERDVRKSSLLQSEMIRALNLKGKAKTGKAYRAIGQLNETVRFQGNRYVRKLGSGEVQIFDRAGRLVQNMDVSGHWIKIDRNPQGQVIKVTDNKGRALKFQRPSKNQLVVKGSSQKATYTIDNKDNLVQAVNSKGEVFKHTYNRYHNLTSTQYSDGTTEVLTYNTEKDWVVAFKDRRGCKESYKYHSNAKSRNHYWTDVRKICGTRVTNNSRYEFWNKAHPSGGQYLYRARQRENTGGRSLVTDMIFDHKTGFPLSTTRNGLRTRFLYNADGTLKTRVEKSRKVFYSHYHRKCKKPGQVRIQYLQAGGKKVRRQVSTLLQYSPNKCHLVKASQKQTGRWVAVKRDLQGRIVDMWDQSKKRIHVAYNDRVGKPQRITRPGIGSVGLMYDKDGNVDASKTKADPAITLQITAVFNGFLEIISPVASDVTI